MKNFSRMTYLINLLIVAVIFILIVASCYYFNVQNDYVFLIPTGVLFLATLNVLRLRYKELNLPQWLPFVLILSGVFSFIMAVGPYLLGDSYLEYACFSGLLVVSFCYFVITILFGFKKSYSQKTQKNIATVSLTLCVLCFMGAVLTASFMARIASRISGPSGWSSDPLIWVDPMSFSQE